MCNPTSALNMRLNYPVFSRMLVWFNDSNNCFVVDMLLLLFLFVCLFVFFCFCLFFFVNFIDKQIGQRKKTIYYGTKISFEIVNHIRRTSISQAQAQLSKTAEAAADLGLVISAPKIEYATVNCNPQLALQVYGDPINHVSDFRYLRSMVASGSSDLKKRKSLAWCAFWKLEQLWKSSHIPIATKVKLFNTTCVTVTIPLFGCESWVISQDMENKINAIATSCYRVMLNMKRIDHVLNTTVYSMTNNVPLIHLVRHRQLKFLGHILRMSKEEPARRYALYIPTIGKRRPGRPRTSYLTYVQRLLEDNEGAMQEQQIAALAADRSAWRNLVVACSAADG